MNITLHTARKTRPCGIYHCDRDIEAGALYVRHVGFPGEEGCEEATAPVVLEQCVACADELGRWLRDRYNVPAFLGAKVVFDGKPGRIAGFAGGHLRVLLDGETSSVPVHPSWRMEYLDASAKTPQGVTS